MTPRRRTLKGTTAQLAESDGWFCPRSSLRFFLFKTARLLFLESALTNSLYCSDFQIASHWPPNDARVTDVGSRAVCTGPLPTIPCTFPSLRATRPPPRVACSGTPARPLFTLGSTLESHLSQFYPTPPSFQVSATEMPPPLASLPCFINHTSSYPSPSWAGVLEPPPLTPGFIFPSRRPTPGGQGPCLITQLLGLELVLGRVCE